MSSIPVVDFEGQGLALGQAIGECFRPLIQGFVETFAELNIKNTLTAAVDKEILIDLCSGNVPFIRRFAPLLHDEMIGLAQGADVDYDDILLLNCFLELNDIRVSKLAHRVTNLRRWGCTTFNVKPRGTAGGQPLLGQTYDMERYFADYNVILRLKDSKGRQKIIYTLTGVLALNGLNDLGLSVVINKLIPLDSRPGIIYPILIREALDQDRIGDSLAKLAFSPRSSGMCYQLSSPEGLAFCLETTAAKQECLPFREAIAHTNHYQDPNLKPLEGDWLTHGGSYVRLQVAQDFLGDHLGKIDPDLLMALCRDHANYPRSVCAHAYEEEPEHERMATIAAVIIEPQAGTMRVSGCYPCQSEVESVGFKR
jgi:isopenicillin-N N-acyltransferase-like protein